VRSLTIFERYCSLHELDGHCSDHSTCEMRLELNVAGADIYGLSAYMVPTFCWKCIWSAIKKFNMLSYRNDFVSSGVAYSMSKASVCNVGELWSQSAMHCRYFDTARKGNHSSFLTRTLFGGQCPLPSEICTQGAFRKPMSVICNIYALLITGSECVILVVNKPTSRHVRVSHLLMSSCYY